MIPSRDVQINKEGTGGDRTDGGVSFKEAQDRLGRLIRAGPQLPVPLDKIRLGVEQTDIWVHLVPLV
jgi:hypothetical protein